MQLSTITPNIKHCKTLFSKARGLMFTKANPNRSVVFHFKTSTHSPLHMFGVFYPIDVLFLNENKEVIEIKENFKPFTFYNPKNKSSYIIELPKGKINEHNIKLKDKIEF